MFTRLTTLLFTLVLSPRAALIDRSRDGFLTGNTYVPDNIEPDIYILESSARTQPLNPTCHYDSVEDPLYDLDSLFIARDFHYPGPYDLDTTYPPQCRGTFHANNALQTPCAHTAQHHVIATQNLAQHTCCHAAESHFHAPYDDCYVIIDDNAQHLLHLSLIHI